MRIAAARALRMCFALMTLMFVVGIGWTILSLPSEWVGLGAQVAAKLNESGTGNLVTAVLLNFRSYDTLLEIGVLLLAVLAVRAITSDRCLACAPLTDPPGAVLDGLLRLIAPLIVLFAGYLLWAGGHAPGGAFQAGALLATLGVLVLLCRPESLPYMPDWQERILLSAGMLVFIGVGLAAMLFSGNLLQYPPDLSGWLILAVEGACALSIAAVLASLFAGGRLFSSGNVAQGKGTEKKR